MSKILIAIELITTEVIMNITSKILIPMSALIMIGMSYISYDSYKLSAQNMQEAQQELNVMAVTNTISELHGIHEFNVLNAISLSQTGLLQPYLIGTPDEKLANTQGAIDRIVNMRKTYSYVMLGIVNTKGIVLQHTERDRIGSDISQDYMFKTAMQGEVKAGLPFLFKGEVVYAVSSPVYKTGTKEIIGVVFNATKLLDSFSERIPLGQKGTFLVADIEGQIFMSNDQGQVLKTKLSDSDWGSKIQSQKSGNLIFEINGEEKFAYFDEQKDTGWIAVAALDVDEANASSLALGKRIIFIAVLVTIIILFVTGLFVLNIRKSLLVSVNFAKNIASGKLDNPITNISKDETGDLTQSLQSISGVLKSIIDEYSHLEYAIKRGDLNKKSDAAKFKGEFANLVEGTNDIIASYVAVIDNIPSPVVVLDVNLCTQYLNKIARDLAGVEYKGKTCKNLFNRDDDSTDADGLKKARLTKQPQRGETKAHPQNKTLDIVYNAIPLLDPQTNEVNAMLQLITDVTAFKASQQTILDVAEEATHISSQVASASQELSGQLKNSDFIASNQAQKASSASAIMEAMDNDVSVMSTMAKDASEASLQAKNEAVNGSEVVNKAIKSISVVEVQSQNLKSGMGKLKENANAINEVITTISDIADQTNLLALNAAIEAARAGESGRGFAVVADEVRKLAEKTMASTVQVQSAITTIQDSVSESVEQVNQSANEVQKTSQLVNETGAVFQTIMVMVEESSTKAQDIAHSSEQQADNSHKVNETLNEVNELAAKTSKNMQESLNSIEELSSQSQALSELITRMKN